MTSGPFVALFDHGRCQPWHFPWLSGSKSVVDQSATNSSCRTQDTTGFHFFVQHFACHFPFFLQKWTNCLSSLAADFRFRPHLPFHWPTRDNPDTSFCSTLGTLSWLTPSFCAISCCDKPVSLRYTSNFDVFRGVTSADFSICKISTDNKNCKQDTHAPPLIDTSKLQIT